MKVLARLYRRLFLTALQAAFDQGRLQFHADLAGLAAPEAFAACLRPLRATPWVVFAKCQFGGPEQVLDYLGRYTHRVAITNRRLVSLHETRVSFLWKDYRHHDKRKVMTLDADEFIRRFLLHVLPDGFRRIRHYGYLANGQRAAKLALCRRLLAAPAPPSPAMAGDYRERYHQLTGHSLELCPCCGGRMVQIAPIPRPATPRRPAQLRHFMNRALDCTITPCPASAPLIGTAIARLAGISADRPCDGLRRPGYRRALRAAHRPGPHGRRPSPAPRSCDGGLVSLGPTRPGHPHRPITIARVLVPRLRSIRLLSRPGPTGWPMLRAARAGPHRTLIHSAHPGFRGSPR